MENNFSTRTKEREGEYIYLKLKNPECTFRFDKETVVTVPCA
jgi:hypothetical protein